MGVEIHRFTTAEECTETLAQRIGECINAAVTERSRALVALSGGSTPKPLYRALALRPLPWSDVTVTLADERWVPAHSPDSNEGLLRQTLLKDAAQSASLVGLKNNATTPADGLAGCETTLAGMALPFDAVLLGMGQDGHTASLFPNNSGLAEALQVESDRFCVATHAPVEPHERMSLTLAALLANREIILLLRGEAKWQIFEKARNGADPLEMPVRAVLQQESTPVHVFWSP